MSEILRTCQLEICKHRKSRAAFCRIAVATSSRKPAHMITNTLLQLQAKQKVGSMIHSTEKAYSQEKKAAVGLPALGCTVVEKQFISKRKHSWQVHLEGISPFLLADKGIWWREAQDGSRYMFFDGKDKPDNHCEGFSEWCSCAGLCNYLSFLILYAFCWNLDFTFKDGLPSLILTTNNIFDCCILKV